MLQETRKLLTISEVAKEIGRRTGHRPSTVTVWRWSAKSVGPKGRRLPAKRYGGRLYVDPADLDRFVEGLQQDHIDADEEQKSESQKLRMTRSRNELENGSPTAKRRLRGMGVGSND